MATIEASQASLREYEWVETTVVTVRGEERSRKQARAYYGAEGEVQKIEIGGSPPPREKRGLPGRLAEKAREGMTDYMQRAMALVKAYVPPDPQKLQAARDAGKVTLDLLSGNRARMSFRSYLKPGDTLSMEVDMANNRPLGLTVATYLEGPSDKVTLNVRMGQLGDGTVYSAHTTLKAQAKQLSIDVKNSGYRKP